MLRYHRKWVRNFAKLILSVLPIIVWPDVHAEPVAAEHGMVVTAQHLATDVGVSVLKSGGNAVDAAVAVGYALAVVYPAAGNLGGGGFMTLALADGRTTFIDFRETAPKAATADMFLDANGAVIPGASTQSMLAVGVPGTVAGLEYARVHYGTRPRGDLLAPAISLARDGFLLEQGDVDMLNTATDDFHKDRASASVFLSNGHPYAVGDRLVQIDLSNTLQSVSDDGEEGFYHGAFGKALAASMKVGGLITESDLAHYTVRERQPVTCNYRGFDIVSAPPPSSGGVILCEMLHILEPYPLRDMGYRSTQAMQVQIEAMRHAYVDRNSALGDPDFVKNPLDRLLSWEYAAQIRSTIEATRAGDSNRLMPGVAPHDGSNTTHYSIVDRWGNAVSVTYTLNSWFGARIMVPGTGVLLNNEMDDFTAKPGVPNQFGLVQGKANAIAPGKRPLSSMTPTIVMREGKPLMVLGTPGGSRIITVVLLTLLNVIDYGMDMQQAVDAPRFHQQWMPDSTNLESGAISPEVRCELEHYGQMFAGPQQANHVAAILVGVPALGAKPAGKARYFGANDKRRNTGSAKGY